MPRLKLVASALCAVVVERTTALDNGMARVPPLGWASWNTYGDEVNASHLMWQADAMVALGRAAAAGRGVIKCRSQSKRSKQTAVIVCICEHV